MVTLITLIIIVAFIIATVLLMFLEYSEALDNLAGLLFIAAILMTIFSLANIASIYSKNLTLGERIEYLYTYNEKIDNDIKEIVSNFQDHETEIFSRESNTTVLIELYPELKSNELVKSQIEIYNNNKLEIKELELERIKLKGSKRLYYLWGRD